MRVEAIAGQYLDVLGETEPDGWSVERALLVARHKTASYTVQRPLHFGMALAGPTRPPAEVDAAYSRYGTPVGEAFQLRDDLLGRVRRPGRHRQAGRRRPAHRQADHAAHAGPAAGHAGAAAELA